MVTGAFFILSKNRCNNGQADVIVAVLAVSIFKNRLDDVTIAIIAVCIFNNGHYDVIIPLLKIDTAIRANCDCYCCGGACNDVNVATAMVPVFVVLFCPIL